MNKKYLPIILVFILTLSVRLFWISQKTYLFHDSITTFSISTPNNLDNGNLFKKYWDTFDYRVNYPYTAKELKKVTFATDGTISSTIKDVKSLYLKHYDPAHSNLYFILMRIWNFDLKNINLQTLIWHGCTFNLLLFSLSFFVMFKLLQLIVKDEKYITVTLLLAFINTASIATTLLIREYQLQGLFFLIVTYIFTKIYLWINENKNIDIFTRKNILLYSLALALFSLSGYYALIYEAILLCGLIFISYKNNIKLEVTFSIKILSTIFLTLCFILIFDPNFFKGLYDDYVSALGKYLMNFNILAYKLYIISEYLQKTLFYTILIFIATVLIFFVKIQRKEDSLILLLITLSFIWTTIVFIAAPYEDVRYFLPAVPILSLAFVYFLRWFNFKYTIIVCLIYLLFSIFPSTKLSKQTIYKPFLFYVNDIHKVVFKNPANLPVVFSGFQWTIGNFIIYSNDNSLLEFIDYIPDKNFKHKEYILFYNPLKGSDDLEMIYKNKNNVVVKNCNILGDCYVIINNKGN